MLSASHALKWECRYFYNEEFMRGYKTCQITNVTLVVQLPKLEFSGSKDQKEWVELVQIRQSHTSIVPNEIFVAFTNIMVLEMMNVSLKILNQDSFKNAEMLKRFWARDNMIETIPDYTFLEAVNMTHIGLQNNSIRTVEPHAFDGLENLQTLKLEFNKIKTLPDEVFWPLIHLDHLHFRDNQLEKINEKLLKKNCVLKFINFQNNKISYIHNHAIDHLTKLDHLILLNNVCIDKDLSDVENSQLKTLKIELHKCFSLH